MIDKTEVKDALDTIYKWAKDVPYTTFEEQQRIIELHAEMSKILWAQIMPLEFRNREIKHLYKTGNYAVVELATQFGCTNEEISEIIQ